MHRSYRQQRLALDGKVQVYQGKPKLQKPIQMSLKNQELTRNFLLEDKNRGATRVVHKFYIRQL